MSNPRRRVSFKENIEVFYIGDDEWGEETYRQARSMSDLIWWMHKRNIIHAILEPIVRKHIDDMNKKKEE